MTHCLFASDLHGHTRRYEALLNAVRQIKPQALFLGGDLLPFPAHGSGETPQTVDFVRDYLAPRLRGLHQELKDRYPSVFVIPGNDDPRSALEGFIENDEPGLWTWVHGRVVSFASHEILGYGCVPPTPFMLKDWERYDVGPYVPPGCVSPEEGVRTFPIPEHEARYATILGDLDRLAGEMDMDNAILLAHAPPYRSALDRAALDGKVVDHAPLDVHVGSVAIRRFIETRQPRVSLHGHIHESARLTGSWRDRIGRTHCLSAAHDGPDLALVRFDLERPEDAVRELR